MSRARFWVTEEFAIVLDNILTMLIFLPKIRHEDEYVQGKYLA